MKTEENTLQITSVGAIPAEWKSLRAKVLYRERKELSKTGQEELLSASHLTGITKRSDKDVGMFMAETLEGYKIVSPEDAVVNTMWAWMGALGTSSEHGVISPSYGVYSPVGEEKDPRFFDYLFRSAPFVADINRRSKGIWSSRLRLYPDDFLAMRLPVPPIRVQHEIADFLDNEINRIDQLISKKLRFVNLAGQRIEALVSEVLANSSTPRLRFENITRRVLRPVVVSQHSELIRLGLYNRGRGIFKKPAADQEGMGDSDFFFVEPGDLILSGQFAWEGSVALATQEEMGCVVSHRYPVFRARANVSTAYLLGLLRSSYGDFLLNEASRGSAGRNRPLNTWRLGKEKIPVPTLEAQAAIEQALSHEQQLKKKVDRSIQLLTVTKASLIASAITGQIDAATYSRTSASSAVLEQIEERLQG